jgi:ABC-type lipoprotein export system ATPase subunit
MALQARDISFSYGEHSLLTSWSADFIAGETVAITGPSGRGKSTLMYILGLMLTPQSGAVFIDGINVSQLSDRRRAHLRATQFGFVFQDAALDPTRTVIDNVVETELYRGGNTRHVVDRAHQLLEQFGVELRADARPGQVSGGQAQRIALCRALLGSPPIVLADEPTGNLDPKSAGIVLDAFDAHASNGASVIIVTHDPSIVERCSSVVRL